jgi:hypothetical protein
MTDEIPVEIKIQIIQGLIQEVDMAIFRMTCAYNANRKVGTSSEQLKAMLDELTRLEGLKMAYQEQLKELENG